MRNRITIFLLSFLLLPLAALAQTAPVGLAAGSPASKVNLNWTASATPAAQVAGYDVFRATTAGGEAGTTALNGATPVVGTAFVDSTAVAGQTYFYVVSTQGTNSKLSAFSNEVTAAVPSNPAPPVLGVVTFSILPQGKKETIVASYSETTPGTHTAFQLWSGKGLLKSGVPTLANDGKYSVSWTGAIASAPHPSLTIEDDAGNVATSTD